MNPWMEVDGVTVYHGDCIDVMRELPPDSVHAVVTDPPYGLEFMGKEWDSFAPANIIKRSGWDTANSAASIADDEGNPHGRVSFHKRRRTYQCATCGKRDAFRNPHPCGDQWEGVWVDDQPVEAMAFGEWSRQWAIEALRVLKPGGHLLAFGGTRTWHRLAVAIEDAGFEVRDSIAWMYGSGFPKSLDVSKAIDKAAGVEREVVGPNPWNHVRNHKPDEWHGATRTQEGGFGRQRLAGPSDITAPATPAAQQWQGWGTALKPAFEPIVVARKPLIGTVAENVLAHGTGALNIDGCRVGTEGGGTKCTNRDGNGKCRGHAKGASTESPVVCGPDTSGGRWPSNVILDESQAAELDKQSGYLHGSGNKSDTGKGIDSTYQATSYEISYQGRAERDYGNVGGGASRFFYVPKANSSERPRDGEVAHPTVKPLELMRYLVKLVTPPGGTVLEPFAGSGTTLEACIIEGFNVIGIEITDDYLPLIRQRVTKPIEPVLL